MSKQEFLTMWAAMYRVASASDSLMKEGWAHPDMAGFAGCQPLDYMMRGLVASGVVTDAERLAIYDTL